MPNFAFQLRRGTTAQWAAKNPVLSNGEPGIDMNKNNFKIGDGLTRWSDLPFFITETAGSSIPITTSESTELVAVINAHVNSLGPHQAYDEGPSLALLYQNAKV